MCVCVICLGLNRCHLSPSFIFIFLHVTVRYLIALFQLGICQSLVDLSVELMFFA